MIILLQKIIWSMGCSSLDNVVCVGSNVGLVMRPDALCGTIVCRGQSASTHPKTISRHEIALFIQDNQQQNSQSDIDQPPPQGNSAQSYNSNNETGVIVDPDPGSSYGGNDGFACSDMVDELSDQRNQGNLVSSSHGLARQEGQRGTDANQNNKMLGVLAQKRLFRSAQKMDNTFHTISRSLNSSAP